MFVTASGLITVISILGTAAFALSAVMAANEKRSDIFTVIVLGITTAVLGIALNALK